MGRTPVDEQVEGQCVVVTAGASGIGRAMVDAFLEAGARVHVADLPGHGDDLPDGVGFTLPSPRRIVLRPARQPGSDPWQQNLLSPSHAQTQHVTIRPTH